MSSLEFGWESLLHTDAPSECSLKAALLTTYNRAEELFLAEHLLPLLLKLEPAGEGDERQYFLLELHERLKRLHDCLIVVSSTTREEAWENEGGDTEAYQWIWPSIRHLAVGRHYRPAMQHAKLWMLHWVTAGPEEYLEIVISSANLTRPAFKGQLQAAWRACIKLNPPGSNKRRARWGVLPAFLEQLATHSGEAGRLNRFVELLDRADAPEDVSFIASIPGRHSRETLRRTPWGSAGLREIFPPGRGGVSVSILAPFLGDWSRRDTELSAWCGNFDGRPDGLKLIWIEKNHPWADKWQMPETTLEALVNQRATLIKLRREAGRPADTDRFHKDHRPTDERWSHAKLYSFQRGSSRRMLITSANFSPSAWGRQNADGSLTIRNFELGVSLEQAVCPFADLREILREQDAATSSQPPEDSAIDIWAQAKWNGQEVQIDCRCETDQEIFGVLRCGSGSERRITEWTVDPADSLRSASILWKDAKNPPSVVRLTCGKGSMIIPVFDERPSLERDDFIPPGVDASRAQEMRDELLFERYGGAMAGESANGPLATGDLVEDLNDGDHGGCDDDYSIPAFELARRHLGVVDKWASSVKAALEMGEFDERLVRRDGELLIEAFRRRTDRDGKTNRDGKGQQAGEVGAKLAAEELELRLKHFKDA